MNSHICEHVCSYVNIEQIKSDTKEYIMHDSIYVKVKSQQKPTYNTRSRDGGYPWSIILEDDSWSLRGW